MSNLKLKYISVRTLRYFLALILFITISNLSNTTAYFIAQRTTVEVSEDVIRIIHIIISLLSYHTFLREFIVTDKAARKAYYDRRVGKLGYISKSPDILISFTLSVMAFVLFPNAFAVKSVDGWLEIPRSCTYIIAAFGFILVYILTWIESLFNWQKTEEKRRKEKNDVKEHLLLIKHVIGACLAYPIMAYLLPILFPTFATLPGIVFVVAAALLPFFAVLVAVFALLAYIRAIFIRFKFFRRLKKSARTNGYTVSKIKHRYMSLFRDYVGESFTVKANGKEYNCKLLAGIHYGNPMYFHEEGKGIIVNSIRFRVFFYGARGLGKIGWHNSDELARIETHFSYSFNGEGKKVLIICPTPHSIYATGYGQNRLLDVNDNVYGYTIMTSTAFVNALERNAIR